MTWKRTTMLLVITIATVSLLSEAMFYNDVNAIPSHDKHNIPEHVDENRKNRVQSDTEILDISEAPVGALPDRLLATKLIELQQKAIHNPEVKALLGDTYEFKTFHHVGTNDGWNVELSFYADNKENIVNVVFDHGKIIDTFKYKTVKWTHFLGHAVDHFDKPTQDINGLQMRVDVPNYSHDSGSSFTALLLNAEKDGSNPFNVCDSINAPDDYWAQAGLQFDSNDVRIGWTDTNENCDPTFISLSFSTGDELKFRTYIDDANDEWIIWIDNVDDIANPFTKVISVSNSDLLTNDDLQSSVWFENRQGSSADWHLGFTSDPVVNSAHYQKPTSTSWWFWIGETQTPNLCSDGTVIASDLMSGTFVNSPHDVTFDVSEIRSRCS